jgi:hypothetical protein
LRQVPLNRLLIQPTVQLSWIEQHRELDFEVSYELRIDFFDVWHQYSESEAQSIDAFLLTDVGRVWELHERDHLFALLVGADYIRSRHASFQATEQGPFLRWAI